MNMGEQGNVGKSLNILNPYPVTMIRARIIVKGNIQEVGYRAKVKEIADRMNIKGKVDNLPDGNVEIIVEGDKEVLDTFIKDIHIKNELITVQEVIPKFEEPTEEFKEFTKVIRNEKTEMHERVDRAIDYLKVLITTMNTTSEGIRNEIKSGNKAIQGEIRTGNKALGEKIDCVGNKVKAMHDDMNKRFDWMAETYGEIGRTMKSVETKIDSMDTSMKGINESIAKVANHFDNKTEGS